VHQQLQFFSYLQFRKIQANLHSNKIKDYF